MAKYTKISDNCIFDTESGSHIFKTTPPQHGWREYEEWLKEGNKPDKVPNDKPQKVKLKEYEILSHRMAWQAAMDEGLSIADDLQKSLEQSRRELIELKE